MTPEAAPEASLSRHGAKLLIELTANIGLPVLVYTWAKPDLGEVGALLASSLPPLAWAVVELVRRRRLDILSGLVLAGVGLSLLAFLGGGGVRMLQLREKLVTGVVGLAFLGSVALDRPLLYALAQAAGGTKSASDETSAPERDVKRTFKVMTLAWGAALLVETALCAALVFMIPVPLFLILSPVLDYGTIGALCLWSVWFSRRGGPGLDQDGEAV